MINWNNINIYYSQDTVYYRILLDEVLFTISVFFSVFISMTVSMLETFKLSRQLLKYFFDKKRLGCILGGL